MKNCRSGRLAPIIASIVVLSTQASLSLGETAYWNAPVTGWWNDVARWTGIVGYPNSSAADVMVAATGSHYTVALGILDKIQANSVTINSADAEVGVSGSLTVNLIDAQAGRFVVGGTLTNARMQGMGTFTAGNLSMLKNVTLAANLETFSKIYVRDGFVLDGGTVRLGVQSPLDPKLSSHLELDSLTSLSGTGTIVFNGPAWYQTSSRDFSMISGSNLVISSGITLVNGTGEAKLASSVINNGVINVMPSRYFLIESLVNSGTVTLDRGTLLFTGTTSSATMGYLVRTGGEVAFNSTLTVPDGKLDIDAVYRGPITLSGHTNATEILASAGSTLTLANSALGLSSTDVRFTDPEGITFSTHVAVHAFFSANRITLNNRSVTVLQGGNIKVNSGQLNGSGEWVFGDFGGLSDGETRLTADEGGTLTVGPGLTLRTNPAYPDARLYLGPVNNNGIILADSGRVKINSLNNAGTLRLTDGVLVLSGSMQTSGLGNFIRTGGVLQLDWILLDNTGQVFNLDSGHGTWQILHGTIRGGTVTAAGGALRTQITSPAVLDGVTLAGDFIATGSLTDLRVVNGLTLSRAAIASRIIFDGTQTLGGRGEIDIGGATFTVNSGTLTLGGQLFTHAESGNAFVNGGTGSAMVNDGALSVNGRSLTLTDIPLTNTGLLTASQAMAKFDKMHNAGVFTASNSYLVFNKQFSNSGTLQASASTVILGGAWTNAGVMTLGSTTLIVVDYDPEQVLGDFLHTGATALAAPVQNTAIDLSISPYGPMDIAGATFTNATVSASTTTPNLLANASAQFIGSVLAANLIMQSGSVLNPGGDTITLEGSTITMVSGTWPPTSLNASTIAGTGGVILKNGSSNLIQRVGSGDLTIEAGILIRTGNGSGTITAAGRIMNLGNISAETSGSGLLFATFPVSGNALINHGLMQATNGGSLTLATNLTNKGMILISSGAVTQTSTAASFANTGTVSLSGGTLSITSPWSNTGTIWATDATLNLIGPTSDLGAINATNSRLTIASDVSPSKIPFAGNTVVLNSGAAIRFGQSSLVLSGTSSSLILAGGGLFDVVLSNFGGAGITSTGRSTMSSVTFDKAVISVQASTLTISGQSTSGGTLAGSGTLVFNGSSAGANVISFSSGLLIEPDMSVHSGAVGGSIAGIAGNPATITNQGHVLSRTAGQDIALSQSVVNNGKLEAVNGGTMHLTAKSNTGIIGAGAGSSVYLAASALPNGFSNSGTLTAEGGTLILTGGSQNLGGTLLATNGGMINFSSGNSVVTVPLVMSQGAVMFNAIKTIVASINGSGTVTVAAARSAQANSVNTSSLIVGGSLALTSNGTSRVTSLLVASTTAGTYTGVLDLASSSLIVQTGTANKMTTLAALQSALATGRSSGTWTGKGITSSTLAANATQGALTQTLVIADNADLHLETFGGQEVDDNSLLLTIARFGDATLDAKVDAFDLNRLAASWQDSNVLWSAGDFTGDGKTDAFDLNVLAANWQTQATTFPALTPTGPAEHAELATVIPEPASVAILAAGSAALLMRRKSKPKPCASRCS